MRLTLTLAAMLCIAADPQAVGVRLVVTVSDPKPEGVPVSALPVDGGWESDGWIRDDGASCVLRWTDDGTRLAARCALPVVI